MVYHYFLLKVIFKYSYCILYDHANDIPLNYFVTNQMFFLLYFIFVYM